MTKPKPIIHSRDHEHGGADTVRIHYETVGDGGGGTGSGIFFDTDPQTGGFLHVQTEGTDDSAGIEIVDTGPGTTHSSGIKISENGDDVIEIINSGDGATKGGATAIGIEIRNAGGGLLRIRQTGDGGLIIQNDGTAALEIHSTAAPIVIDSHGNGVTIDGTPVP